MTFVYRILHQEDTECSLHSAGVLVWSRWPRSLYPRPHSPGHSPASVLQLVSCVLGSGLSSGRHWAARNLLPVPGHRPDQPHQGHGHQELRDRVLLHPPGEPTSVKARSIILNYQVTIFGMEPHSLDYLGALMIVFAVFSMGFENYVKQRLGCCT